MFTWKNYYVENELRLKQLDEARHYRMIRAFLYKKESRLMKSPFEIQPKHFAYGQEISYEPQ